LQEWIRLCGEKISAVTSLKYRSDIDGLRAVAVLGVVIYHAFPHALPGGFIGVDIFFVISGYLISGILYKGLANGGEGNVSPFSFREFYARRIRRLFPALITMLVITMSYGWLILLPDEFQQLGKHVAAGTLFIQNIVFWKESGYFDISANLKPLLHLWSLAVEEQFYIFFPPILLLIWKRKWPLAAIMGVFLVISMVCNLWASDHAGTADFFLTPYRVWEFLGGSLLAWWHYDKNHEEDVPFYREALSWMGLLLLGLGMAVIHTGDAYPGWRALLPVAGTLLLMEGGAGTGGNGAWVNRKILSHPAVVWIGLISYPLYLFHWPALSFVHIVKGENPKTGYIVMALLVSFVLTVLTYYFIERKIRHNKSRSIIPALVAAFLITGMLGLLAFFGKMPIRYDYSMFARIEKINDAIADRNMMAGWAQLKCSNGFILNRAGGEGLQTLFLGDSNAQQYAPRILKEIQSHPTRERGAIFIAEGGVVPIPNVSKDHSSEWDKMFAILDQQLAVNPKIDRVVIAARWCNYFAKNGEWVIDGISLGESSGREKAIKSLGDLMQKIVSTGRSVSLVLATPTGSELDPRAMFKRGFLGFSAREPHLSKDIFLRPNEELLKAIAETARTHGAKVIDPMDYLCRNGDIIVFDEKGIPICYDDHHLRPGYVREHVKYLDETVHP
jgi:peptidoglycan/LPS O-acetylase OafA/YrhL